LKSQNFEFLAPKHHEEGQHDPPKTSLAKPRALEEEEIGKDLNELEGML
jgi:hypothetical protein